MIRSLSRCTVLIAFLAASLHAAAQRSTDPASIVIDGDHADWNGTSVAVADADWVYLRFWLAPRLDAGNNPMIQPALQASDLTLTILLDLDGDSFTGIRPGSPAEASDLGVDLEIKLSPPRNDGSPGSGCVLYRYSPDGQREKISHADAGFHFAPTYGSKFYEARIARSVLDAFSGATATPEADDALDIVDPDASALQSGLGAGIILLSQGDELRRYSDAFVFDLPARAETNPAALTIPTKNPTTIRVMSWNVLFGSPKDDPEGFARVFKALKPDVVLLQEWERADTTAEDIAAWFRANVGDSWNAQGGPFGIGIASPHPIIQDVTGDVMLEGSSRRIRYAAAIVQTPLRDTLAASVHLKCCGAAGSEEDFQRIAEATMIAEAFGASAPEWTAFRVLGGDINLVGSREPLDILASGIDDDGSDLLINTARRLGDRAHYTWRDAGSSFSPGRLDYMLTGDNTQRIIRSFVFDPTLLSDQALEAAGLQRTDCDGSDHLPVVVDFEVAPIVGNGG